MSCGTTTLKPLLLSSIMTLLLISWKMVCARIILILTIFRYLLRRCLTQIFLPDSMLLGEKKPGPKTNIANRTCSDNSSPIVHSSNLFKVVEYLLLQYLEGSLKLRSCQFGFRKYTSCFSTATVIK